MCCDCFLPAGVACPFIFVMVSLEEVEVLLFCEVQVINYLKKFTITAFVSHLRNLCLPQGYKDFLKGLQMGALSH